MRRPRSARLLSPPPSLLLLCLVSLLVCSAAAAAVAATDSSTTTLPPATTAAATVTFPLSSALSSPSAAWRVSTASVRPSHPVRFHWLLRQSEPDALRARFEAVSSPRSWQYQQYLTADEVAAHIRPDASVTAAVLDYLTRHGVDTAQAVAEY